MASNVSQAQAQAIVSLFNNAPTQQKYSITIQDSGGNKATTTFTFSLQKPNILSEALSVLNPFNWATTGGEVWTGITTGNADVQVNTSTPVDINNGVNNLQMLLDNQHPFGTEDLAIVTPVPWFEGWLPHQLDNAITVTAKIFYCTSSGAVVGLQITPNSGVINSAGYSIVTQSSPSMTMLPSALGGGSYAFLQVGALDSQILSIAQSAQSANNPSEVYGVGNSISSSNNNSNSTPTVVTPVSATSSSSNNNSNSTSTVVTPVSATSSSSNTSSNPITYASPSNSGSTNYGMSATGASTGGGGATSEATQAYGTPPSSKTTEYLVIAGVAIAGIAALFFFMNHKKK